MCSDLAYFHSLCSIPQVFARKRFTIYVSQFSPGPDLPRPNPTPPSSALTIGSRACGMCTRMVAIAVRRLPSKLKYAYYVAAPWPDLPRPNPTPPSSALTIDSRARGMCTRMAAIAVRRLPSKLKYGMRTT